MNNPTFPAEVKQIIPSTGRVRLTTMALPVQAKPSYDLMIKNGCHLETEALSRSEISVSISDGQKDIAIQVVENGATVQRGMVDMLNAKPWES